MHLDYPRRRRLKIYARAEVRSALDDPELREKVTDADYRAEIDRIIVLRVEAFDWNCPQHITPRWTADELAPRLTDLTGRIAALEAENARLQHELSHFSSQCD